MNSLKKNGLNRSVYRSLRCIFYSFLNLVFKIATNIYAHTSLFYIRNSNSVEIPTFIQIVYSQFQHNTHKGIMFGNDYNFFMK